VADFVRGGLVDGAIIVSAREHDAIAVAIAQTGLPAVMVGHPSHVPTIPYVGIDNRTAAREVTGRLIATGRRRVGMIAAALDRDSGADRLAGFQEALGSRYDHHLVVDLPLYSRQTGVDGMRELLARDPHIDGVFAASDAIAVGALDVLHAAGRRVPEDVGLVGFDDSDWAMRCQPPLSTVRQPADLLGRKAASIVLGLIDGEPPSQLGTLLPTELIWRDSA
jgi:DNA-binding LacI/PurR family transcriptional regulator